MKRTHKDTLPQKVDKLDGKVDKKVSIEEDMQMWKDEILTALDKLSKKIDNCIEELRSTH